MNLKFNINRNTAFLLTQDQVQFAVFHDLYLKFVENSSLFGQSI